MNCAGVRDALPAFALGVAAEPDVSSRRAARRDLCRVPQGSDRPAARGRPRSAMPSRPPRPAPELEDRVVAAVHRAAGQGDRRRVASVIGAPASRCSPPRSSSPRSAPARCSPTEREAARLQTERTALQQDEMLHRFGEAVSSARFADPSADVLTGMLAAPDGRQGAGSALTIVSPSADDQAIVLVSDLPDRRVAPDGHDHERQGPGARAGLDPPARFRRGRDLRPDRPGRARRIRRRGDPRATRPGRAAGRSCRADGRRDAHALARPGPVSCELCASVSPSRSTDSRSPPERSPSPTPRPGPTARNRSVSTACGSPTTSSTRSRATAPTDGPIPALEPLTSLAALAAVTERVRLGVIVLGAPFRHPSLVAKAAATIDQLSGGRVEIGLGAGWLEQEFDAFGYEFGSVGERFDALEDALTIVGGLFAGDGSVHPRGRGLVAARGPADAAAGADADPRVGRGEGRPPPARHRGPLRHRLERGVADRARGLRRASRRRSRRVRARRAATLRPSASRSASTGSPGAPRTRRAPRSSARGPASPATRCTTRPGRHGGPTR